MSSSTTRPCAFLLLVLVAGCSSGKGGTRGERPAASPRSPASPVDSGACSDCDAKPPAEVDASAAEVDASAADSGTAPSDAGASSSPSGNKDTNTTLPAEPSMPEPPPKPLDARAIQTDSPFAIAPSASSSRALEQWTAPIAAIGVQWIRNFEASKAPERLATFSSNKLQVSGTLIWSPGVELTFPVGDLAGWRAYVRALVQQCKGQVKYWEIWNEPPNFTQNKSPADYAKIVVAAYEEVKAIDPAIQVGIAAQSNNVNFLDQALVAGAAGHFDYVTVHPYELLGLLSEGWEPTFMRVVPTIRRMLAVRDPARANAPVWFTEIGQPVTESISEADQTGFVMKAYTLGLAQGVTRIAWFEGIDGDSGRFGLIAADGKMRPAYVALKTLIAQLGPNPRYFGWVLLNYKHYGFVFEGPKANVLVTWARPAANDTITFDAPVKITVPATAEESTASTYALTPSPVIISGISTKLVDEAVANRTRTFPWSGGTAFGPSVAFTATVATGLHKQGDTVAVRVDGESAVDCSTRSGHAFAVDPVYLSYDNVPLKITALVRRKTNATAAGFNLYYESTTGDGVVAWYDVPAGDQWTTATWTITDAQFVGKWGYNFLFESDDISQSQYVLKSLTVEKQ